MRFTPFYILFFALLFGFHSANSQINIRVGYNVAKIQAEKNKTLFNSFNSSEPDLEIGFPDLNILHGFELGLRYNFGVVGFDLGFSNLGRNRTASVYDVTDDVFVDRELNYSMNNLSFGIENVFNRFGYGGTIGYNFFKVKSSLGSENKKELVNERFLNSRFYLMWNLHGSEAMCLSIRPFVELSWDRVNLGAIQDEIFTSPSIPNTELDETPMLFGISFLFYNGPKPRS